jgi:hypothetical protein
MFEGCCGGQWWSMSSGITALLFVFCVVAVATLLLLR